MQVPLDYYRILGLPIQAKPEQLQQAHRDRVLQLPRREYSERAIAARRELLDEAYAILSDPARREAYNGQFMRFNTKAAASSPTPKSEIAATIGTTVGSTSGAEGSGSTQNPQPHIEVETHQVVGALLLLQELGEYEQVLDVGTPLLDRSQLKSQDSELVYADIALTVALAYLELGREYWHQGHYETAAEALERGQDLLLQEGLFTTVRGEIKGDLYKLRPYRVVELVALPEEHAVERRKGIQILRDMLQERGGIDGSGDDQSGLSIDDFLRFVQQLRDYLTAEEQQSLFQGEARRPSAVATYLAVYALLAKGFASHQPEQIRQAKNLLIRLGKRQDVHLEQSICSLLLGQTEEASRALELSREYEAIAFIRENSQGSPDLLPGLCLYAEQWLREEVFPHFRDLVNYQTTLKDYFADEQVQIYLERLSNGSDPTAQEWEVLAEGESSASSGFTPSFRGRQTWNEEIRASLSDSEPLPKFPSFANRNPYSEPQADPVPFSTTVSPTVSPNPFNLTEENNGISTIDRSNLVTQPDGGRRRRRASRRATSSTPTERKESASARSGNRDPQRPSALAAMIRSPKFRQFLLLGGVVLTMLAGLLFVATNIVGWIEGSDRRSGGSSDENQSLDVKLDQPILNVTLLAQANPVTPQTKATLSKADAKQLVEFWLAAKQKAMGKNHETASLAEILTGSALLLRQQAAEAAKREGFYANYEHKVTVETVEQKNSGELAQTIIVAVVDEGAEFFFDSGQKDPASSYNAQALRVQYELVREGGKWRIQDMKVLP